MVHHPEEAPISVSARLLTAQFNEAALSSFRPCVMERGRESGLKSSLCSRALRLPRRLVTLRFVVAKQRR
jgi:hypothetical protein